MQSTLTTILTLIVSLEIGYFLLGIISQFRRLNVVVIYSTIILLSTLVLVQQFLSPWLAPSLQYSLLGLILYGVSGLAIIATDERNILAKKKMALKIPLLGMLGTYYFHDKALFGIIIFGIFFNLYIFHKTKERFRLYLRNYIICIIFAFPLFFLESAPLKLLFIGICIYYLSQLLNLFLVKTYIQENLG